MGRILRIMFYGLLADLVVVLHALFVLFVAVGGLLVFRWAKMAWVHVPSVLWAVIVEWSGWICPLTPLENKLRLLANEQAYGGDFVERFLVALLYPEVLTRPLQMALGAGVLLINGFIYWIKLSKLHSSPADLGDGPSLDNGKKRGPNI
ncbi:MAG: DUF2784 domain-containing protein [bacterium]